MTWRTGYTAAGMGTGAAQVKVLNRSTILGGPGMWAQAVKLIQVMAPMEYIRFGKIILKFSLKFSDNI